MVTNTKVKFLTWSLENLTDWEIRPQCFANFQTSPDSGFQRDAQLNITVYKPSDSVSISVVNHTGPMLEGEHYQLQCEVQNIAPVQYLTVKWYKGETLESQTSYDSLTKTPVNVSSTLLITPTSADDGAQYSCVAELELGPEGPQPPPSNKSDPLSITVNYAPIFYSFTNETLEVAEGQEVALNCSAVGKPLPEYSWSPPHNKETLITSTSLPPGTHVYTCNAKNYLGESRKYFTVEVIVIEPPDSVSIRAVNHTGPMLEGKQYQLQCKVQIIAPVQNLTVKWYKGGTENQTSYDAFTKTPVNVSSTLLITPTSADDGAQYSCVAELELGPSYKSDPLNITVYYKPRITKCPDYMKLTVGESLNTLVSCKAEGNPTPMVTWYRNQSEFNISRQLTGRDAGLYVMTAKNTLGSVNFTVNFLECPLKMEPSTVVVRYGDPVSVNCTALGVHDGFNWEVSEGSDKESDQFITWRLETLTDWETRPRCFGNFLTKAGPDQCDKMLNITVYKPPDSVSISAVNHTGPMLEGKQYQLQCEVQNIAPVQNLTVKLYKRETLENQTSYVALTKTPVNVSSTLLITPTSADDGAQYRCVAELELGPEGPQPPPSNKSDPLNITVNYAPIFNVSNETLKVAEREEVTLNCSAVGNPLPEYSWSPPHNEETLITSLSPGTHVYTCNAKNYLGESTKYFTVEVIAIVDYLPLIAGIVALVVVCISIAFVFIYLIYYKNTKMGEYNLKLGKSRAQNAHVAQNGRDSSLPMKKLTKPSLPV